MGVLTEYVRKEADQIRAELARRKELLDEWLTAISKLYDLLEGWIREADGGLGLLGTNRRTTTEFISEPRLGHYDVNLMWVTFGGAIGNRQAILAPKARYTSFVIQPPGREPRRADGVIEIQSGYHNRSSFPEYYLFRLKTDGGDEWFIRSVNAWNADPNDITVEPLDRERFEAAMLRVLQ
jgi:hypothetical protein